MCVSIMTRWLPENLTDRKHGLFGTVPNCSTLLCCIRKWKMNPAQQFAFDLQGFLVVPNALSQPQVSQLAELLDDHAAAELSPETRELRAGPRRRPDPAPARERSRG